MCDMENHLTNVARQMLTKKLLVCHPHEPNSKCSINPFPVL